MIADTNILHCSLAQLQQKIKQQEITAVSLLDHVMGRLKNVNAKLNAITHYNTEDALIAAQNCDELTKAGKSLGPLHGIPLTIKDSINVNGLPTTLGCQAFADFIQIGRASCRERV